MDIDLKNLRKVEGTSIRKPSLDADAMLKGILKVKKADYVPVGVTIRTKIDSHIYTIDLPAGLLETLEKDKQVSSISVERNLHPMK